MERQCVRMDFVRTEVGKGGPTMIRCGFIPAYFPELILPLKGPSPERERERERAVRTGSPGAEGDDTMMWFGATETMIGDK